MEKAQSASASRIFITALAAASACAAPNAQVWQTPEPDPEPEERAADNQIFELRGVCEVESLNAEIAALREGNERLKAVLLELERADLEKDTCGKTNAADKPRLVDRSDTRLSLKNLKLLQGEIKRTIESIIRHELPYTAACDHIRRKIKNRIIVFGGRSYGKPRALCSDCPEYFRFQPDDGNFVEWYPVGNPNSNRRPFHVWIGSCYADPNGLNTAPNLIINGICAGRTLTDDM